MVQRPQRADTQVAAQPAPPTGQAKPAPSASAAGPDPRAILDSIGEVVYDWDVVSDRLTWGPNALSVLGVASLDRISSGRAYSELITSDSLASRYAAITGSASSDSGAGVPYRARYGVAPGGSRVKQTVWLEDTGRWFAGADGKAARAHGLIRVITSHYEAERELEFRSRFDALTNCYNRAHVLEIVTRHLSRTPGRQTHFCILLASLENLFVLNRTYGYDVADEVIAGVARRLRGTMRGPDSLGRYAGAKFSLVLDNCDRDQMMIAAQRFLNETSREPFETTAGPIPIALRIGGVAAPRDGRTANLLFQHAEEALDLARASGATRLIAYEPSLARNDTRVQAARMADDIVGALNDGRVTLALQPIVDSKTRRPAFSEALIRLRQPDGSIVSPGAILPIAEKAGLVHLLDQRALELAVARLQADPGLTLSVNVSGSTIHDPDWPERFKAMIGQSPAIAARLIVEITETCAIADVEATHAAISCARSLGVRVAMDDFGAGHTSFRNLRRLPFDLIKMDGAFVQNLARSPDDRFFVRTLIDLAHHMNLPIVAEWVEDAETAKLLTEWGVEYMQGVHFADARIVENAAPSEAAAA
ncbi:MAG TPA: bifunctional diguanylate cyclase/phosphodiesterase [Rhodoblastus sp.]|nr:bifunctional diguanylate cyclase/phosphodiesterase [Rhodoblastus sp.]